ncbi:hypothetical protein [Methanosarcina barkeri]|nr:hypothetical protein [Methanosarcina barkeri]
MVKASAENNSFVLNVTYSHASKISKLCYAIVLTFVSNKTIKAFD